MALTRTGPLEDQDRSTASAATAPAAPPAPPRPRLTVLADPYAAVAPRADAALRSVHLEALLADPRDEANPYGFQALAAARRAGKPAPAPAPAPAPVPASGPAAGGGAVEAEVPAEVLAEVLAAVRAEVVPVAAGGNFSTGDQLVRVLRPLFRRDVVFGHGHVLRELHAAAEPGSARQLATLLGPAALIAAAGTVLRGTVRIVAEDTGMRRWRAPLAVAFADLLACDTLVTVGLRATALPEGGGPAVRAAAGYAVPVVLADVLDEVGLVLDECGLPAATAERRLLAGVRAGLPAAGADRTDVAARQADLVRELPALAAAFGQRRDPAGPPAAAGSALFRLDSAMPARSLPPEPGSDDTLVSALTAAHDRLTRIAAAADVGGGEPVTPALTRVTARLLSEQRALARKARQTGPADPADPAVRALADRQALVLLAAAVLGVQGAAHDGRDPGRDPRDAARDGRDPGRDPRDAARDGRGEFLAAPHWALLAASRVTERLGIAPDGPGGPAAVEARDRMWDELDTRDRYGVDCDVYATRVLW
ncbi:hypothetical protein [Streptomyces sp. NPDC051211]|uniref:hypothetical protein n=1 Tax=Streptomyces sp. NPDC051211 TaxID=3154643 RepID=UPI00344CC336